MMIKQLLLLSSTFKPFKHQYKSAFIVQEETEYRQVHKKDGYEARFTLQTSRLAFCETERVSPRTSENLFLVRDENLSLRATGLSLAR